MKIEYFEFERLVPYYDTYAFAFDSAEALCIFIRKYYGALLFSNVVTDGDSAPYQLIIDESVRVTRHSDKSVSLDID